MRRTHVALLMRRARRSVSLYWLTAAMVGLAAVGSLSARSAALDRRERRLELVETVLVTTRHVPAGSEIGAHDVEPRRLPRALAPAGAVTTPPTGQRTTVDLVAGEVLVRSRLADGAASPLAAQIRPDRRAVAVAIGEVGIDLSRGDRLELWALGDSGRSTSITEDGVVIDRAERSVTVEVPARVVAQVLDAHLASTLSISLIGPDDH